MFDDITDAEYAEWKDWFETGNQHWLLRLILLGIALLGACTLLRDCSSG